MTTGGPPPITDAVMYFQNSVILSAAYVGCHEAVRAWGAWCGADRAGDGRGGPEMSVSSSVDPTAAFMSRLDPPLRNARLLAVHAEGHYIRVRTTSGSPLLLFRLKDAMHELRRADGAQTHRSWWVARRAVRAVERRDGKMVLHLEDGAMAPVSRANVGRLKGSGWLADS